MNMLHSKYIGLNRLYYGLCHSSDVTIAELYLRSNALTVESSSLISELIVKCKVKVSDLSYNYTVGEDQQLYTILTDPSNNYVGNTLHV